MKLPNWKRFPLLTIFPKQIFILSFFFFFFGCRKYIYFRILSFWVFPMKHCKLNILQRWAFNFLKDFLSCFPRHSFTSDEVKKKKGSPEWLHIASLKLGVCQIPNPETEFLMVKFKTLPFRSFILLVENKKQRGKS